MLDYVITFSKLFSHLVPCLKLKWKIFSQKASNVSTYLFSMFPFDSPENIKKPKVFCCWFPVVSFLLFVFCCWFSDVFKGDQKGTLERNGLRNIDNCINFVKRLLKYLYSWDFLSKLQISDALLKNYCCKWKNLSVRLFLSFIVSYLCANFYDIWARG